MQKRHDLKKRLEKKTQKKIKKAVVKRRADNPKWLSLAVEYLTNNVSFRTGLFSDSTEDANAEGRDKKVAKNKKIISFGTIADYIFRHAEVSQEWKDEYEAKPSHFAKSLQQQFSKLKSEYRDHVQTLYATGGGLEPEDVQANLIGASITYLDSFLFGLTSRMTAKIRTKFPHWDELDSFWRELPNYNPKGISNGSGGVDHSAHAENLFQARKTPSSDLGDVNDADDDDSDIKVLGSGRSSSPNLASSVHEDDVDDESSDSDAKPVKKRAVQPTKLDKSRSKPAGKPSGHKRSFDVAELDSLHREEMAESAKRQKQWLELEVKRAEVQVEKEKTKRAKLEYDRKRLQAEQERDRRMYEFMGSIMGHRSSAAEPHKPNRGGNFDWHLGSPGRSGSVNTSAENTDMDFDLASYQYSFGKE
ncbi:hypothetical protein MVEN_00063500 [Mycena venus]|uniref:Uncharacterized protein n=1 Tax=Mycena venus TaxID=2733690 RepID=A0A8H6Z790_9AGAR|nr:hypothetical protein MVEN_00063500 [Mycena venus]